MADVLLTAFNYFCLYSRWLVNWLRNCIVYLHALRCRLLVTISCVLRLFNSIVLVFKGVIALLIPGT